MSDTILVNFEVPRDLLKKFDEAWQKQLWTSRTEILRVLMRQFIAQNKGDEI